jgi:hypothetical protein
VDSLEVAAGGALQPYEFKVGSGAVRAGGRAFERAYFDNRTSPRLSR